MDLPPITVVISTRNRGETIVRTVQSILLNDYPDFELRIVDQSTDDVTEACLQPLLGDRRIRCIRSATQGPPTGRNIGIRDAQTEFIAITDDDCEAQRDWLREMAIALTIDPRIGVVFGNVVPGPHDNSLGFVPSYVRSEPCLARSIWEKHLVEGVSACMGLRLSVWKALGGFDQMFGIGAPLKSASETDLTIRALLAGYSVYETPRVVVIHHGFYRWAQRRTLTDHYWYGTGAAFCKTLKLQAAPVAILLCRMAWRWAFSRSRVAASLGNDPWKLSRLAAFIRGFAAGAVIPVDQRTGHFVREEEGSKRGNRT